MSTSTAARLSFRQALSGLNEAWGNSQPLQLIFQGHNFNLTAKRQMGYDNQTTTVIDSTNPKEGIRNVMREALLPEDKGRFPNIHTLVQELTNRESLDRRIAAAEALMRHGQDPEDLRALSIGEIGLLVEELFYDNKDPAYQRIDSNTEIYDGIENLFGQSASKLNDHERQAIFTVLKDKLLSPHESSRVLGLARNSIARLMLLIDTQRTNAFFLELLKPNQYTNSETRLIGSTVCAYLNKDMGVSPEVKQRVSEIRRLGKEALAEASPKTGRLADEIQLQIASPSIFPVPF